MDKMQANDDRVFRLLGNTNQEMQEIIDSINVDDEVSFYPDVIENRYIVDFQGDDIGYLPKAANDCFSDIPWIPGKVTSVEMNDSEIYIVYVSVPTQ